MGVPMGDGDMTRCRVSMSGGGSGPIGCCGVHCEGAVIGWCWVGVWLGVGVLACSDIAPIQHYLPLCIVQKR